MELTVNLKNERKINMYSIPATSKTPALVIYLLDVSGSMSQPMGASTRIDVVTSAVQKVAVKMVQRSTKGTLVAPRYRVAMLAYSDQVIDLLNGIKTIDEVAKLGVPRLTTLNMTDAAAAFAEAERLLAAELPNMQDCPAPLVCHMTDGEYNGSDPSSIVERIKQMAVPDGNVLVENIYVKDGIVSVPDVSKWPGLSSNESLNDQYGQQLLEMSSPIPDKYREVMQEFGYQLASGAKMFFPADKPELVELGFVMSGATPVTR